MCRSRLYWTWMPPTSRYTAISRSASSTATTAVTAICRCNIFAGDQLLCARLRAANQDAAAGAVEEVSRIVIQLRQRWPQTRMVLRADSGFCREESDGLVRGQPGGLPVWLGAQPAAAEDHRCPDAASSCPSPDDRQGGARLYRLRLYHAPQLVARPPRGGQSRVSRTRARIRASWSLR